DTDVLIEYLRGKERAAEFLEGIEGELMISVITVAELFSGVRGTDEMEALDQFLPAFLVIPVDEHLARRGGLIRQEYHPSHGVGLADALIAATALDQQARLVTFNRRHYPMLSDVVQPYRR
ncbi:MAG TPA: type II toxin-antitoxin system VapC family toxin, partial [Rhodothermales bacterium]|nr:type II toxin-antitoxin system VapC family toxin [Rhodothermales bacterium]